MPHLPTRRPSAAMLVAATALVSSLAGPAVADEVAHIAQSITSSKQIKNGSVTGADIANGSVSASDLRDGGVQSADIGTGQVQTSELGDNAVRGDKIQPNTIDSSDLQDNALRGPDVLDNSLTGADIDEGSLGKVPNAAFADNAANLGGRGAGEYALKSDLAGVGYVAEQFAPGEEVTVAEGGGVRIFATCDEDVSGPDRSSGRNRDASPRGGPTGARLFIDGTVDDVAYDDNNGPEDTDFDAEDGPSQLFQDDGRSAGGQEIEVTDSGAGVTAVAPDGTVVAFNDYALGNNLAGDEGSCFVSGTPAVVSAG